jgi:hypothetical protein
LAEMAAEGKFNVVDDSEADAVIEFSTHAILHNEEIGRALRNMYGRLQVLEREVSELKRNRAEAPKRRVFHRF